MKKTLLILFLFYFSFSEAKEYRISPYVNLGYGTYQMKSLNNLLVELAEETNLDPKLTDEFPAFINYDIGVQLEYNKKYVFGLSFTLASTQGRMHRSDYSGEISIDMPIYSMSWAGETGVVIKEINNESKLLFLLRTGLGFTRMDLKEKIEIYGEGSTDFIAFKSYSYFFEPNLVYDYNIDNHLSLLADMGYFFNVGGKMKVKEYPDATLVNGNEEVKSNWSGIRFKVGIKYSF